MYHIRVTCRYWSWLTSNRCRTQIRWQHGKLHPRSGLYWNQIDKPSSGILSSQNYNLWDRAGTSSWFLTAHSYQASRPEYLVETLQSRRAGVSDTVWASGHATTTLPRLSMPCRSGYSNHNHGISSKRHSRRMAIFPGWSPIYMLACMDLS